MDIDAGSLTARFSNPYPYRGGYPPEEPYFERVDRADATIVDQFVPLGGGSSKSRLGFFLV
jgi:hypothetical protein